VIRGAVLPAQRGAADRKPRRLLGTADADGVQLHQYATGTVRAGEMTLSVRTDYPWDGRIEIGVEETPDEPWTLTLRVPGWAHGATLDGEPVAPGAARVTRTAGQPDLEAIAVEPGAAEECAVDGLGVAARDVAVQRGGEWPYGDPPAERGARHALTLIPYHTWANRGPSTMRVWMPV
jgi:DUF1680 family protein